VEDPETHESYVIVKEEPYRRLAEAVEAPAFRVHRKMPGSRQPRLETFALNAEEGITVMPVEAPGAARLPLLGIRPISRTGLKLVIDGKRREVTLKTPGWS
jgi:hypothetical protein